MESSFYKKAIVLCIISVSLQLLSNGLIFFPELNIFSFQNTKVMSVIAGFAFALHSYYFGTFLKSKNWRLIANLTYIIGGLFLVLKILEYFISSNQSLFGLLALLSIAHLIFMIIYPLSILALGNKLTFHLKRFAIVNLLVICVQLLIYITPFIYPIRIYLLPEIIVLIGTLTGLLVIPIYKEDQGIISTKHEDVLDFE
ncbi:MAG: hypothetical protein ABJG68_03850 [Crocinitomicaceae bacterium]